VCEVLGIEKNHWSHKRAEHREFMFCFFRHPADRLVSWWEYHTRFQTYRREYQVVFPEWIRQGCPNHHDETVSDVENTLHQHQFINHEVILYDFAKINELWPFICDKTGTYKPLHTSLPTVSIRRAWEEYYNKDTYRLAKEMFSEDWKIYEKINPAFTKRSHLYFA